MDPALNSIMGPWAQYGIVGSVVLALGAAYWVQSKHVKEITAGRLADLKACGERYADLLGKKIESDNALVNALERISDRIKQ